MQVQDVMTKDVSWCAPATNAAAAAEIMWNRNCGILPVVGDGGRVVGMVTDRDLFIALGTQDRRASDLAVGEVMNQDLSICAPDDDLRAALKAMGEKRVHRLVVVDEDGALKGILSMDDVVSRAKTDGISAQVMETLRTICDRPSHRTAAA